VSYFTAVLAREGRLWTVHDLDVDAEADLAELTVDLRAVAEADEPVLLLVEREDAWWAVVRVDGDEDPRVFVSDLAGAAASPYADLLALVEDDDEVPEPGCGGDLDVLADLGTPPDTLQEMCDDEVLPMDALATVAEAAGFAEVLDALR
jgi:putative tRNA adenosine deaminase-associated protein